jgi:hypothetical protein
MIKVEFLALVEGQMREIGIVGIKAKHSCFAGQQRGQALRNGCLAGA